MEHRRAQALNADANDSIAPAPPTRATLELVAMPTAREIAPDADSDRGPRATIAARRAANRRALATDLALQIPGLRYATGTLDEIAERHLIARLETLDLAPIRASRAEIGRRAISFGWHRDGRGFERAEGMPDFLLALRERVAALIGTPADRWEQASIAQVDAGDAGEWHRERPVFEQLVELNLGAPARLRLRQRAGARFDRHTLPLEPRSLHLIEGDARHLWEYRVESGEAPRWSVSFRTLSARGLRR